MLDFLKNKKVHEAPLWMRPVMRVAGTLIRTIHGFLQHNCMVRASALTYYTLLSIVPIAALVFAISKGFGLEERIEEWLHSIFSTNTAISKGVLEYSRNMLVGAKGGVIAGVGAVALLYATIRLLTQVENSLNRIWGVAEGRSLARKASDYLTLMLIFPIFIAAAGSMNMLAGKYIVKLMADDFTVSLVMRLLPFLFSWLALTLMYMILPNTKVRFIPALVGGFTAGLAYILVQKLYLTAQFVTAKYNAIYGGFAALPLFLIWLNLSWTIILFGSELAYSVQTAKTWDDLIEDRASPMQNMLNMLRIMQLCAIRFSSGETPLSDTDLAEMLNIPFRLVHKALGDLLQARLLQAVLLPDETLAYQVAYPTEKLTFCFVLNALQKAGSSAAPSRENFSVQKALEKFWASAGKLPENKLLTDVVF